MKTLSLFLVLFYIVACGNSQSGIPDVIDVKSKDGLERLKGTKLFVSHPANYQYLKNLVRLQRDNNSYIQVMEVPGSNILDIKEKLTDEEFKSKGAKVDELKHITYNGYEAIYYSGPSKKPEETKFAITFGDRSFAVIIVGVCKSSDKAAKEELTKIMTTS